MIRIETPEDARQIGFLLTPPGGRDSGRTRYAAAMHFHRRGLIGDATLEVYRVCALIDAEDPRPTLERLGLDGEVFAPLETADRGAAIRELVAAIDLYLADLPGPGVVDVLAGIALWGGGVVVPGPARTNPVVDAWLGTAVEALRQDGRDGLAAAIAAAAPHLRWTSYDGYPPGTIGAAFADGHAYATILGEGSPIATEDFELGLFLIAPGVFYRDHQHPAPELYAPLTGPHGWRFAPGDPLVWKGAHEPVWNPPFRPHAMLAGDAPFLAVFGWTSDVREAATIVEADDWPEIEASKKDGVLVPAPRLERGTS